MAVMKGQAWNVVETLKTPDHGPLELTRRARVCVWDDLVDVPVAVPMRMASSDMRRKAEPELHDIIQEEMDIGAANSSSGPVNHGEDLLGLSSPLPHPGRFELATSPRAQSPEALRNGSAPASWNGDQVRPSASQVEPRSSYQGPLRTEAQASQQKFRHTSFASARRHSNTIAQQMYDYTNGYEDPTEDDGEGDLGYAAAEGMEGNRRKVIVERLETVKAKNPVFSWC
jgi:phosphatidylinositol 4-kinase type 2